MISLLFVISLIGIECISGSPNPLVSSSGMMPLLQAPGSDDEPKELTVLANDKSQTYDDEITHNKKYLGLRAPEPETSDTLRVKKSAPEDNMLSMFSNTNQPSDPSMFVESDPLAWSKKASVADTSAEVQNKPVIWGNHDIDSTEPEAFEPQNVIYTNERKAVLHPYISDADPVTIPTLIVTPSTSESSALLNPAGTLAVPAQVQGRSTVLNRGGYDNDSKHNSLIDGGESSLNDSNKILINSPNFVFVDENHLHSALVDDLEAPSRIVRTSHNDTTDTSESPNLVEARTDQLTISTVGPPWEDNRIVGKLFQDPLVEYTEVSFKVASKLCQKISRMGSSIGAQSKRYYLWAPINQYIPLLRKAFPIRPPIFAPECLKWVLRQCRGTIKLPLLKPCTYWAPMPIRRPECGFNPNLQSKLVNYRPPEYVPGNCPCVWPCVERFDPIQRCRVTLNETQHSLDHIHPDGDPWNEAEITIQDNLAAQLCRGMKLALTVDDTLPIGWIPIRADVIADPGNSNGNGTSRRKRDRSRRKRKVKREEIFVKPGETPSASSADDDDDDDEDDDRFTLMGTSDRQIFLIGNDTTNGTTIKKCRVWKYKPCPREQISQEVKEYSVNLEIRRKKRSIPEYMSRLALGLNDDGIKPIWNAKRFTRQTELDEDDVMFKEISECGEWILSDSFRCVAEERLQLTPKAALDSSSEEENDHENQLHVAVANQRRQKVKKDLCPGSVGKFPCFLRRKRSVLSDEVINRSELEEGSFESTEGIDLHMQKRQSKRDDARDIDQDASSSTYVIRKIQIRPDSSCMCEWPCLPFFDRVNHCYNLKGDLVVDNFGRPKVSGRSFRKSQRDPVVCINFVEIDEIYCKIKD